MFRIRRGQEAFLALSGAAVLFLGACSGSRSSGDAADAQKAAAKPSVTVPAGSSLTFVVGSTISTESQHTGDTFDATLDGNVHGVDGHVALPVGTTGRWVVSQSTDNNGSGEAVLAVRLQSLDVDGHRYPVSATVVSSDLKTDPRDSGKKTAAKIGIGAAAGAIVGRVLGDDADDALKGAGVGAALGTAIALSTRNGSAELPQGAHVTVRLDRPLTLAR